MSPVRKEYCDGPCDRLLSIRSLVRWKDRWYCGHCRIKIPSWKVMFVKSKRTKKEIKEIEDGM